MKINSAYVRYLKGSFYKCLCLFEEKDKGLTKFIESLTYEIQGLQVIVPEKEGIIILSSILEHFKQDSLLTEPDIKIIRKQVFNCMDVIDGLLEGCD